MTEAELLEQVKIRLGITGDYQDTLLQGYIDDVKLYLSDAGVPAEVLANNASVGVIARGVADSWNYGSGDGEFSQMFYQRAEQLRHFRSVDVPDVAEKLDERITELEKEVENTIAIEKG